jgi:hypothetical protein
MNSKRTSKSKDYCIRSGGYPDSNIKNDIYTYLLATATYQNDLIKASNNKKENLKKEESHQVLNHEEVMATFGIL